MASHGNGENERGREEAGLQDIKKLSPQERIKRLKELEEARRREIEEAESLIKETVLELEDAEERKKIPIPEAKATELSTLETLEGKQLVATHHFLSMQAPETATAQQPQPKNLEEIASTEAQQPQQQQPQQFQKPAYAIGTAQQRPAFGEYLSRSQQTVTAAGMPPGSQIEEKITEFYKDKTVTGTEQGDAQQKYFGTHQQVTGGYEIRKREEDEKQKFYESQRRKAGPA